MGYTTEFRGTLVLNKQLTEEDSKFLKDLNATRRMKRNLKGFGIDGEFFIGNLNDHGQVETLDIVDYNSPPSTQPGLWCHWIPTDDDRGLEFDGGEKAYAMEDWVVYLINRYLEPRGYVVTGMVEAQGEESGDIWAIKVDNNIVYTQDISSLLSGIKENGWKKVEYNKAPKIAISKVPRKLLPEVTPLKTELDK